MCRNNNNERLGYGKGQCETIGVCFRYHRSAYVYISEETSLRLLDIKEKNWREMRERLLAMDSRDVIRSQEQGKEEKGGRWDRGTGGTVYKIGVQGAFPEERRLNKQFH